MAKSNIDTNLTYLITIVTAVNAYGIYLPSHIHFSPIIMGVCQFNLITEIIITCIETFTSCITIVITEQFQFGVPCVSNALTL